MGIDIDNKLECLGQNFKKAHTKAQNIISNWKARKLPINGRITISECLIISQFNYVASIINPTQNRLKKSQYVIVEFIRDSTTLADLHKLNLQNATFHQFKVLFKEKQENQPLLNAVF